MLTKYLQKNKQEVKLCDFKFCLNSFQKLQFFTFKRKITANLYKYFYAVTKLIFNQEQI